MSREGLCARAVGRRNHLIHLACEGRNLTLLSGQHAFPAWALLVVRVHPVLARRPMTLLAADEWSVRARLVSVMYKAPSSLQSSLHPKATRAMAVMPATRVTQNRQNPALRRHSPGPGEGKDFESHYPQVGVWLHYIAQKVVVFQAWCLGSQPCLIACPVIVQPCSGLAESLCCYGTVRVGSQRRPLPLHGSGFSGCMVLCKFGCGHCLWLES